MRQARESALMALVLCCLGRPTGAEAQARSDAERLGAVVGVLRADGSGEPLNGARLTLRNQEDTTTVAAVGISVRDAFRLPPVAYGVYTLTVEAIGYRPERRVEMRVDAPVVDIGVVSLAPAPIELEGILATADPELIEVRLDRTVYRVSALPRPPPAAPRTSCVASPGSR